MSSQIIDERFFVASFREDGQIEGVEWFPTLEDAKKAAELKRKMFPKSEIMVGQRLVEESSMRR